MSVLRSRGCCRKDLTASFSHFPGFSRDQRQQRAVFLCFVANRFSNLNSRSAVCCHKKRAALFTQTYRCNLVVIGEAFFNRDSRSVQQRRRETGLANDLISASPPLKSYGACQGGRMDEICVSVHVSIPNSHPVLDQKIRLCHCSVCLSLQKACVASKCPLLQVCEQVACTDGLPVLANGCCVRQSVK